MIFFSNFCCGQFEISNRIHDVTSAPIGHVIPLHLAGLLNLAIHIYVVALIII
jgi:hypothetical protein